MNNSIMDQFKVQHVSTDCSGEWLGFAPTEERMVLRETGSLWAGETCRSSLLEFVLRGFAKFS